MERLNLIKSQLDSSLARKKTKAKEASSNLMPYWVSVNKPMPKMEAPEEWYSLKGKVAVITGGNRGIGYAVACHLAEEGCNLIIGAKTIVPKEKTQETIFMARDQIIEKYGVKCIAVKCDVRLDEDLENLVKVAVEAFGQIDILVNNAAALIP